LKINLSYITRKPEKTNGITDGNILSVIIIDGHNSVSKSIGIYRQPLFVGETVSIYRWKYSVVIYRPFRRRSIQFVWKYTTAWWCQTILPRDSNWDSRTVMCHFYRRKRRWNHRWNESVGDFIGKNHYIPTHLPTLSSSVSPSSSFPFHLSPPKLLPNPLPSQLSTILNTSTQVNFLYLVRGHNIRFL